MIYTWILPLLFWSVLALCGLYSLRHGGPLERRVFVAIFLLAASQLLFSLMIDTKYESTEVLALIPDMMLGIFLMVIALTTDRFWPLWAAALQSVAVLTHLAVLGMPQMMPTAYAVAQGLWLYGVLIALIFGVRSVKTGATTPVDGRVVEERASLS